MKKSLSLFLAACLMIVLAACSDGSSDAERQIQPTDAAVESMSSQIAESTVPSAQPTAEYPSDADKWDGVIGGSDDGGYPEDDISDALEYKPAGIIAKIIGSTDGGFEAEILAEYELDLYSSNQTQEVYFMRELRNRLDKGDRVTLIFDDDSVIAREGIGYTSWKYGFPDADMLHAGTVVSVGVGRISADKTITCSSLSYGEIITEDTASYSESDYSEWEKGAGSGPADIEELPYAVVRIDKWDKAERETFEFTCTAVEKSDDFSGEFSPRVSKSSILFYPDKEGTAGFGAPSEKDFPEGSTVKIYYAGSKNEPVCIERVG